MSGQWIEGDANRSEIPEPSVVAYYPADPKQNQLLDRDLSVLRRATADIFVQAIIGIFCAICGVFLAREGLTQFRLFSQRVSESVFTLTLFWRKIKLATRPIEHYQTLKKLDPTCNSW
jgi:hypothetical protein